ncbi:MAG TPA: glycosyltransferase, partial [Planctomycetota bacterium]|nr:glycosyltransferase [Planctomycetota bacterium]
MSATLSIVVPLFQESERMELLRQGIESFLEGADLPFANYEFLFVDDGSRDDTWQQLEGLCQDGPHMARKAQRSATFQCLRLDSNQGKGAALRRGVLASQGDWVLTLDADWATDPLELVRWYKNDPIGFLAPEAIQVGSREHPLSQVTDHPLRRGLGRCFNAVTQALSHLTLRDTQCGFKLYPGPVARRLFDGLRIQGWAHDVELLERATRQGSPIVERPVHWSAVGNSRVQPLPDSLRMLRDVVRIRVRLAWEDWRAGLRNPWWRATAVALFAGLVFVLATFGQYGLTVDEPIQHLYGQCLAKWYTSGFADRDALKVNNLYLYGGAFEVWPGLLDQAKGGLPIYALRHLMTALLGLVGVMGAIRLTHLLSGQARAAFFVAILLLLHPLWWGHTFINSKDTPFAVGYVWSLYYIARLVRRLPRFPLGLVIKLGLVLGWTMGVRVGGVVLYPIVGLGLVLGLG